MTAPNTTTGQALLAPLLARYSMRELGRRVGVTSSTCLRWVRGSVPRPAQRRALFEAFGIDPTAWTHQTQQNAQLNSD